MVWAPSLFSYDYIHQLTDFCHADQKFWFALDDSIGISEILQGKKKMKIGPERTKVFPIIQYLGSW